MDAPTEFPAWDRDRYEKPSDDPAVLAYLRAKEAEYDARHPQGRYYTDDQIDALVARHVAYLNGTDAGTQA